MHLTTVLVPQKDRFYTLYSDGPYVDKTTNEEGTLFTYLENSILFLYYTYPTHRRAYAVRCSSAGTTILPGLSFPVNVLIRVHASKVDKLKKSVSFLVAHYQKPYDFSDAFYTRLHFIIQEKGKINYEKIKILTECLGSRAWI